MPSRPTNSPLLLCVLPPERASLVSVVSAAGGTPVLDLVSSRAAVRVQGDTWIRTRRRKGLPGHGPVILAAGEEPLPIKNRETWLEVTEPGPVPDGIAGLGEDDGRRADAARDRLAGALVELLSERGGRDQVLVSSFDAAVLDLVAARSPACRLGWLTEERPGPTVLARLAASGHVAVHPHWTVIDAGLVEAAHRAGLAVFTWTVDDPASVAQLATLGVDAIITNGPDVALLSLGRGPG